MQITPIVSQLPIFGGAFQYDIANPTRNMEALAYLQGQVICQLYQGRFVVGDLSESPISQRLEIMQDLLFTGLSNVSASVETISGAFDGLIAACDQIRSSVDTIAVTSAAVQQVLVDFSTLFAQFGSAFGLFAGFFDGAAPQNDFSTEHDWLNLAFERVKEWWTSAAAAVMGEDVTPVPLPPTLPPVTPEGGSVPVLVGKLIFRVFVNFCLRWFMELLYRKLVGQPVPGGGGSEGLEAFLAHFCVDVQSRGDTVRCTVGAVEAVDKL